MYTFNNRYSIFNFRQIITFNITKSIQNTIHQILTQIPNLKKDKRSKDLSERMRRKKTDRLLKMKHFQQKKEFKSSLKCRAEDN